MERLDTTAAAELYVRSLAPSAGFRSQERALSMLDELVAAGRFAGYDVLVWGDAVCPAGIGSRTVAGRRVLDRVDRIERWTADSGATVGALRSGEYDSRITGERRTVTRLPSLALAEFEGDDLVHFAPCRTREGSVAVLDRLASLSGAPPGDDSSAERDGSSEYDVAEPGASGPAGGRTPASRSPSRP